jgi:hypothetical protein
LCSYHLAVSCMQAGQPCKPQLNASYSSISNFWNVYFQHFHLEYPGIIMCHLFLSVSNMFTKSFQLPKFQELLC